MATRFFTNEGKNTLLNKFKGIFEYNTDIECFDALVGYFYSSGYFAIRPFLDNVPHIRILVGIDADHIIAKYNERGLLWKGDDEETVRQALLDFRKDIATCKYSAEIERGIKLFVEDVATGKIEIRAHTSGKLHAKIYIFRPKKWNEHKSGYVITGSSNLTDAGLGASDISNYEFNVQLQDFEDVEFATNEFEKLWRDAAEVRPSEIETLKTKTHLNDQITPFELYVKMLASYFGQNIEYSPDRVDLPPSYKKLTYQIDAVNQGFDKLCRYNGFFLADVVGLGKTVVALLIAKKFFYSNGYYNGHVSKTLIICPPALVDVWKKTAEEFGLNGYKIITNGSIHKEEKRFDSYDLVIVDEAHKFRNQNTDGYNLLSRLCKTPSSEGSTLGKSPHRKKVILISATLQNNGPEDIKSLTYLFQDARETDLDIPDLEEFFNDLIKRFNTIKNHDIKDDREEIRRISGELRNNIIYPLTVRRTRADLTGNELYRNDLEKQKVVFPEIGKPEPIFYKLNTKLNALFDKTLNCLKDDLNYSRYKHITYLKPEHQSKYKKTIVDHASDQLAGMMKNILVKRLDSSFHAFKISLNRFLDGVNAMLKMLDNNGVYILSNVKVADMVLNGEEEKLEEFFEKQDDAEKYYAGDFRPNFREDLIKDKIVLENLVAEWNTIEDDPKYDEFITILKSTLLNKKINPSGKIVVFSEAEDTTDYIYRRICNTGIARTLAISARNRDSLQDIVIENFDANHKEENQKNDYDIIICTEVLAEGVNLHRAGVVVNYDTPWNSTRLMQRIGRINRIGSPNKFIRIYNFFPTAEVNETINLEKTAKRKLLAFHHALGSDSQIYSPEDEEAESFGLFSTNPTEEQDEQLSVLLWLRKFKEEHIEEYKRINDLPLKLRAGRKESLVSKNIYPADATVAYIKNTKRDIFYAVSNHDEPKAISFLEAEKLLKCEISEPRCDIPELHYSHIAQFLDHFERQDEEDASKRQAASKKLTPHETKAINFLKAMIHEDIVNDQERKLLQQAIDMINKKQFPNFYKAINKISKHRLERVVKLRKLLLEVKEYVKNDFRSTENVNEFTKIDIKKPEIVISETFVH